MNRKVTLAAAGLTVATALYVGGGSVSATEMPDVHMSDSRMSSMAMHSGNPDKYHVAAPAITAEVAPARVVENGEYSDIRFIDITVPHHLMAIEMAKVEIEKGANEDIRKMAQDMIDEQVEEIAKLKQIRLELTGSAETPTMMNPEQMQNSGMPSPEQLAMSDNVDLAFLDAMIPHHSSLIPMANTVLVNSGNEELKELSRQMLNAQAEQVGHMIEHREELAPEQVEPEYAEQ